MSHPQRISDLLAAARAEAAAATPEAATLRVVRQGGQDEAQAQREAAYRRSLHAAGVHERFAGVRLSDLSQDADEAYARIAASIATWTAAGGRTEDRSGRTRTGILLTGGFGVGKTTLATAAFKSLLWHTGKGGLWRKTYAALRYVQAGYATGEGDARLRDLQTAHVLLLDDIGDVEQPGETDDRARLLYEVLDTRSDRLLPTILTSNLPPDKLAVLLGSRAAERVREMCAHFPATGPNRRIS